MKKSPKHIIISHVYSRANKGDAVLTSVLIADLKRQFPQARLTILALQPDTHELKFEGVPEKAGFMSYVLHNSYHPLLKLLRALYMISATFLWAVWLRSTGYRLWLPLKLREIAELYAATDLIVPVGGGHIRSQKGIMGLFNVPLLLHPLLFAYILHKPTILYSQSIGPFRNVFEEKIVAFTLKRMTLILLREDTSMKLLDSLGVRDNTLRAIDSGFLHTSKHTLNLRKRYDIPTDRVVVGVTVRAWLKGEEQTRYEKAVAKTLDTILNRFPAHVIFIPQVTASKGDDDRMVSRRVYELMKHKHAASVIETEPDHHEIKALYDNLDLLLGTRFHSVIFSLTSYVPVVAIEYEHKTSGIMRDLDLEQWVVKIEDVTASKLTSLMKRLFEERADYKNYLHQRLPAYVEQAQQNVTHLHQAYEANITP